MAKVKFYYRSKKEQAPVTVRFSHLKEFDIFINSGYIVQRQYWNASKGIPKTTDARAMADKNKLTQLEQRILERFNEDYNNRIEITKNWLQFEIDVFFKRAKVDEVKDNITDAIQDIIDNASTRKNATGTRGLTSGRIYHYKGLKQVIERYQGRKVLKVKDVDPKFAQQFLNWMMNKEGYAESYALKKINDLKTVCVNSEMNGAEVSRQLKAIKGGGSKNKYIIYLTTKELAKIKKTPMPGDALKNAKKWLLLGCNIGQRGGDLLNISDDNFVKRNNLQVIELVQQKTGKNVTIPVLGETKEIYESGLPYKIAQQNLNYYIKEVCQIAGISEMIEGGKIDTKTNRKKYGKYPKHELITTHVCRRSFASNLYGVLPTPLIMQITGHSTEKMLIGYIGKGSYDYAQQIADFYELQEKKQKQQPEMEVIKNVVNEL